MLAIALLFLGFGSQLPRIVVDTDPENMLPADQGARVLHDAVKRDFTLYDMLIVGVVDETDADGVFTPAALARIHELTGRIQTMEGVVRQEVLPDPRLADGPRSERTVCRIWFNRPVVTRVWNLLNNDDATSMALYTLRLSLAETKATGA